MSDQTIKIAKQDQNEDNYKFNVMIIKKDSRTNHTVTLSKSKFQDISLDEENPEDLVKKSFQFLLDKEPKESILSEFRLKQINDYLPDFERKIKQL